MTIPPLMLFAAGFGTRMGALTAHQPKPLIKVAGRALIDHARDVARSAGVARVVVNLHYRGEQLEQHLQGTGVDISWERAAILETGGGLKAALPLLAANPVLTLNPDAIWTGRNPLTELLDAWDPQKMDALLLLLPLALAGRAKGDFRLHDDGRIARGGGDEDHVYVGAQVLVTDGLAKMTENAFSLNLVWNDMIARGRAFGVVHQGGWCDVGHPAGIPMAEAMLKVADV